MAKVLASKDNIRIQYWEAVEWGRLQQCSTSYIIQWSRRDMAKLRYFVAATRLLPGGALALLILQIIQHRIVPNENSSVFYTSSPSYPCILLYWTTSRRVEFGSIATEFVNFFQRLSAYPKYVWSSLHEATRRPLASVDVCGLSSSSVTESAKELFLHYGEMVIWGRSYWWHSEGARLISLCHPFNCTGCFGFSLQYMLTLWCDKRTALLRTRGECPDKLRASKFPFQYLSHHWQH